MDLNKTTEGNQTEGNQTDGYYYEYYYEYELLQGAKESFYIALVLQWVTTVLIVSLNTAVIITILRCKKKSRFYFLLRNMAIADLITGLIDALVNALERTLGIEYMNYRWFGGDFLCRLQRTLSSTSLCASNFILAATSIDRAFVIAKPMINLKRGYTLQKILISVCWLLSFALSSPMSTIYSQVSFSPSHIEGADIIQQCDAILDIDGWKVMFYLMFTFYFLIPLILVIVSYTILVCFIYKRARTPPNCVRGVDNLKISLVFNKGLPSSKSRSIKLTFGIVLGFIGAWTPFMVMFYMSIFQGFTNPVIMPFVTTFYWNCVVNPILFFVFHRRKPARQPCSACHSDTLMSKLGSSTRATPDRIFQDHADTTLPKPNQNVYR